MVRKLTIFIFCIVLLSSFGYSIDWNNELKLFLPFINTVTDYSPISLNSSYYIYKPITEYNFKNNGNSIDNFNNNNGIDTNITYNSNGAVFNKNNSHINTTISSNYLDDDWTMCINLTMNDEFTTQNLVGNFDAAGTTNGFGVYLLPDLEFPSLNTVYYPRLYYDTPTGNSYIEFGVLTENVNYLLCIGQNNSGQLWGKVVNQGAYTIGAVIPDLNSGLSDIQLGESLFPGDDTFNGSIQRFWFYDRYLNFDELDLIYKSGNFTVDKNNNVNNSINLSGNEFITLSNLTGNLTNFSFSLWVNVKGNNTFDDLRIIGSQSFAYDLMYKSSTNRFTGYFNGGYHNLSDDEVLLNTWYHIVTTVGTSGVNTYVNGVFKKNYTLFPNLTNKLVIGSNYLYSEGYKLNGSLDEIRIYNRSLEDWEVQNLYNSFNNFTYNISSNISVYNQTNSNFTINISNSNFGSGVGCGIFSNNSNVICGNTTSNIILCNLTTEINEIVNLQPFCNLTNPIRESNFTSYYIDNVYPTIITNFNNLTKYSLNNITGQFNFSDTGSLYRWNITIDGNNVAGAVNPSYNSYSYNLSINPTTLNPGKHYLVAQIADGHTANELKEEYKIKYPFLLKNELTFEFPDKNKVTIEPKNKALFDSFSVKKEIDRYKFTYESDKKGKESHIFIITSDKKLDIIERENTKYKKWLVTGDKWVDFYMPKEQEASLLFNRIDDYNVEVIISNLKNPDKLEFESVGDLNIVTYNFTFYTINSTASFTNPVYEGQDDDYVLTVNFTNVPYSYTDVNATFYYNNTEYTPTKTSNTNYVYFTNTLTAPSIDSDTNISLYWNISYLTNPVYQQEYNQTITTIKMANCEDQPGWYKALTFICQDESTLTNMTNVSVNMDIDIELGDNSTKFFSFEFRDAHNYSICVETEDVNYTLDAKIEYYAENYSNRKYYLNNYELTVSNDTVYLYSLDEDLTSDVIMVVYDSTTGDRIKDAYVKLLRYYPGVNDTTATYKTVQIEKSDINGETGFKAILADVWYKQIVEYPAGTVLLDSDIEKILSTTKYIPVRLSSGNLMTFNEIININSDVSCDRDTQICRFTWSNPSGESVRGELKILEDTGFKKIEVWSDSVESSAATIAYTVTGNITTTRYVAEGWIYTD